MCKKNTSEIECSELDQQWYTKIGSVGKTVSGETQFSYLGSQGMVAPFITANKHTYKHTHFYYALRRISIKKQKTKKQLGTLALLYFSHKINYKIKNSSLIKCLSSFTIRNAQNTGIYFKTTHRESSCLKRNLVDGFPSFVYHTCSSGISL